MTNRFLCAVAILVTFMTVGAWDRFNDMELMGYMSLTGEFAINWNAVQLLLGMGLAMIVVAQTFLSEMRAPFYFKLLMSTACATLFMLCVTTVGSSDSSFFFAFAFCGITLPWSIAIGLGQPKQSQAPAKEA